MVSFAEIVAYFAKDPLRLLSLVGGSGGVAYWFDRWKDRPRVIIHELSESLRPSWTTQFELENVGTRDTSVLPFVDVSAMEIHGRRIRFRLVWAEAVESRLLQPHRPVTLTAIADDVADQDITFTSFRRYTVRVTRGRATVAMVETWGKPITRSSLLFSWRQLVAWWQRRRLWKAAHREVVALQNARETPNIVSEPPAEESLPDPTTR
jgi:hypothetical protein